MAPEPPTIEDLIPLNITYLSVVIGPSPSPHDSYKIELTASDFSILPREVTTNETTYTFDKIIPGELYNVMVSALYRDIESDRARYPPIRIGKKCINKFILEHFFIK